MTGIEHGRHNRGDLVQRCLAGDPGAWDEFYARYRGLIERVVRHAPSPIEDPDDVIQEAFVHLFKALKSYDPSRPLEVFILEIARRVRISRYRKSSALKRGGGNPRPAPIDAHDDPNRVDVVAVEAPQPNQEEALVNAQETLLLRRALRKISESCRELLGLRYEQGLSYGEISRRLGVKEGTLRVRAQRCLSTLARLYAEPTPQKGSQV